MLLELPDDILNHINLFIKNDELYNSKNTNNFNIRVKCATTEKNVWGDGFIQIECSLDIPQNIFTNIIKLFQEKLPDNYKMSPVSSNNINSQYSRIELFIKEKTIEELYNIVNIGIEYVAKEIKHLLKVNIVESDITNYSQYTKFNLYTYTFIVPPKSNFTKFNITNKGVPPLEPPF